MLRRNHIWMVSLTSILTLPCLGWGNDWYQFRGPSGNGHAVSPRLPVSWSEQENVAWSVPVPGRGWSSPSVANQQIWLTTALQNGRDLRAMCFDAATGETLLDVSVFPDNEPLQIHKKNSHASPTPYIDRDRVYIHYGTYGTACLDTKGNVLWRKKLDYEPNHGPGGSPVVFEDLLIVSCDGTDQQYVVALDKHLGTIRWKTSRAHITPERKDGTKMPPWAFSTPTIFPRNGGPVVISAGGDHVSAYDVRTGTEVWWSAYDGYSVVPRPTVGKNHVFVSSCYDGPVLYAIRLGGRGNVTDTHVAWKLTRGAPHNPSPVIVDDAIYVISDKGIVTCLDVASGKRHWQKRLGGGFSASPLVANGLIYFLDESGETTVIEATTDEYREVARNSISGQTLASFAVIDDSLLLRNETHLYRLGK